MFDHVQIKVSDLEKSRRFYERVLSTLGHKIVLEVEDRVVGIGKNAHDMFEVHRASEDTPLSQCVHIAFAAKDMDSVRRFYQVALENGATDNGAPGLRPDYEEGYFAAFVIDPDGHNLEAVFSATRGAS